MMGAPHIGKVPARGERALTQRSSWVDMPVKLRRHDGADMRRGVRANGREYVAALCAGRKPFLVLTSARLVGPAVRWAGPGLGGVAF